MLEHYEDVLTVEDVCEILMIGRNRVYELLSSGTLKGFKIGQRCWRIPKKYLSEYIENLGRAD